MNWLLIYEIIYFITLVCVCLYIIYDTRSSIKTLAYVLLLIFLPVIGMIFYLSFGINYRKRKIYSKKIIRDEALAGRLRQELFQYSKHTFEQAGSDIQTHKKLAYMLAKDSMSTLSPGNDVKLLINGENKFPEVLQALAAAKNHIHIEYYIYEDGETGRSIEQLLIKKVKEGVTVRFIYDDFGSHSIRKGLVKRLKVAGVQAYPFYKVLYWRLANRLNYRNHRKLIIVDGHTAFVGGINVSDRYVNKKGITKKLFWRDTHLRISGPGAHHLQYVFMCDWNFCAKDNLQPNEMYFPRSFSLNASGRKIVQIAASGPDSDTPTILFSVLQAINLARNEILITTPYFIPGESLVDALIVASLGGVSVKLLVPGTSDSKIVNAAAHSYYEDLLAAGIEVYLYSKGFLHAKTIVTDRELAIIGTANMDHRSFDLNFEVNALVYDRDAATELANVFYTDLQDAEKINLDTWINRPLYKRMIEKTARLLSPLL
jgi:cardiolipin synthase